MGREAAPIEDVIAKYGSGELTEIEKRRMLAFKRRSTGQKHDYGIDDDHPGTPGYGKPRKPGKKTRPARPNKRRKKLRPRFFGHNRRARMGGRVGSKRRVHKDDVTTVVRKYMESSNDN